MVQELFDISNNLAISVAKIASSMSWKKNNIVKNFGNLFLGEGWGASRTRFSGVKNNFLIPQKLSDVLITDNEIIRFDKSCS